MIRLLRRAELNDAKIVPIINKLFPPPEGHKSWMKYLLPKEESHSNEAPGDEPGLCLR